MGTPRLRVVVAGSTAVVARRAAKRADFPDSVWTVGAFGF